MADPIVPNVVVSMPSQLFTLARSFKAAANGKVYIGKIDTDPTIPENQIQVYVQNEDDSLVPIAQPIVINAGGYPVYGGQISKFVTVEGHSMAVYDSMNVQQFYFHNILKYNPDQLKLQLGYLTPEMFGASGDGVRDDFDAIVSAVNQASAGKFKTVFLGAMYKIRPSSITVPSGVNIVGGGSNTGVTVYDAPAAPLVNIFNLEGSGTSLDNFAINLNTGGRGDISAVQLYGVHLREESKFCSVRGITINGKPPGTLMGFSHGVRCNGVNNTVEKCNIQYCSMGITYRGNGHKIDGNYCNNHFVDENLQVWSPSLPWWDGITGEGAVYCTISNNTTEYNGQSGIYLGGNNSLSHSNKFVNNTTKYNYNRGLDVGVSGTPSTTHNVYKLTIEENNILNNRVVGLWAYKANDCIINNNITEVNSGYAAIWGSFGATSNRQALAVAGDNCNVAGNRIYATEAENFGYSVSGVNTIFDDTNYVSSGAPNYINDIMYNQKFKNYTGVFTPVVGAGSTGLTIVSGTGSYVVNDNRATYKLDVLIAGVSAVGNLYLGLLPYIADKLLTSQSVTIEYVSALNSNFTNGSELIGYIPVDSPQQICIARRIGGSIVSDIPSCIGTGTRFRITVDVDISTTTTVDTSPGVSFFGHSFLSEQGLANGVGESLGLRVYNYARGGSSSTEAALIFGAITHNYMPVGGVIPASGSVDLSPQEDAVWYAGAFANVTLAGVQGVINSVSVSGITNRLVFTRSNSGGAVSVPSPVPLIVLPWTRQNSWSTKSLTNHPSFRSDIVIIQCLRNNSSWEQGMTDVASIVASLGTDRFVILAEFPYANETTGTPGANTVNTYNAKLKAAYPNNYCQIGGVDLLGNFKARYNPAYPQDVTDISNGVTPSSLRYDTLHPSRYVQSNALAAGVLVNAEFIARFIRSKGWA
ncbi:right-handed parallel beta-helix repeat-containing protein [Serratia fonticola]|uniref:phage tailspike protein n=1 Tax=Serratia fonticola TaxID=47917 RepID=UPI0015C61B0C|nr:phage tailspike protein [Serratia fonticola]NXZ86436.1 right-handed parallel beta-helix repeat-containing protein [Serratia fonticola]